MSSSSAEGKGLTTSSLEGVGGSGVEKGGWGEKGFKARSDCRSLAWSHFQRIIEKDETGKDTRYVVCQVVPPHKRQPCGARLIYHNSTSSLLTHLRTRHPEVYEDKTKKDTAPSVSASSHAPRAKSAPKRSNSIRGKKMDSDDDSPEETEELFDAVRRGDLTATSALLGRGLGDPWREDVAGSEGRSCLFEAVARGFDAITKMLLIKGGEQRAFLEAIRMENRAILPFFAVAYGVGVNKLTDGEAPLHLAARLNLLEVFRDLLDKIRVDPLVENQNGDTVLHVAAREGSVEVVREVLLRVGRLFCADRRGKAEGQKQKEGEGGKKPVDVIEEGKKGGGEGKGGKNRKRRGQKKVGKQIQRESKREKMEQKRRQERAGESRIAFLDINQKNRDEETAVHLAVKEGNETVARLLLLAGAKADEDVKRFLLRPKRKIEQTQTPSPATAVAAVPAVSASLFASSGSLLDARGKEKERCSGSAEIQNKGERREEASLESDGERENQAERDISQKNNKRKKEEEQEVVDPVEREGESDGEERQEAQRDSYQKEAQRGREAGEASEVKDEERDSQRGSSPKRAEEGEAAASQSEKERSRGQGKEEEEEDCTSKSSEYEVYSVEIIIDLRSQPSSCSPTERGEKEDEDRSEPPIGKRRRMSETMEGRDEGEDISAAIEGLVSQRRSNRGGRRFGVQDYIDLAEERKRRAVKGVQSKRGDEEGWCRNMPDGFGKGDGDRGQRGVGRFTSGSGGAQPRPPRGVREREREGTAVRAASEGEDQDEEEESDDASDEDEEDLTLTFNYVNPRFATIGERANEESGRGEQRNYQTTNGSRMFVEKSLKC
uniref:Ankyrin repeat-containing protein n=1 Tax=Chromera velia CCMP2878 TaxID=1169474 RepID=A0A0G4HR53_9ALVE|eukprot:Cvel_8041.t1-p1 / transcript=Cvel_8041.t1 / gene=Cvel_8041 / organism=Chromera_velia_CCMP2878 / gene_product=hypothetical protein / transcript_product=hypothetical protein / location=Cvel_scaffold435:20766-28092(-) / protein_length=834 / sequence_SO=supercontig / SO=protein_coding / is_pseudo=false